MTSSKFYLLSVISFLNQVEKENMREIEYTNPYKSKYDKGIEFLADNGIEYIRGKLLNDYKELQEDDEQG